MIIKFQICSYLTKRIYDIVLNYGGWILSSGWWCELIFLLFFFICCAIETRNSFNYTRFFGITINYHWHNCCCWFFVFKFIENVCMIYCFWWNSTCFSLSLLFSVLPSSGDLLSFGKFHGWTSPDAQIE